MEICLKGNLEVIIKSAVRLRGDTGEKLVGLLRKKA